MADKVINKDLPVIPFSCNAYLNLDHGCITASYTHQKNIMDLAHFYLREETANRLSATLEKHIHQDQKHKLAEKKQSDFSSFFDQIKGTKSTKGAINGERWQDHISGPFNLCAVKLEQKGTIYIPANFQDLKQAYMVAHATPGAMIDIDVDVDQMTSNVKLLKPKALTTKANDRKFSLKAVS